jgi:hypothetical protein
MQFFISYNLFFRFISSEKRTNVLPHMPPDRRKFVHDVCAPSQLLFFCFDYLTFSSVARKCV